MIEAGADTFAGQIPTILKVNSSNSWATSINQAVTGTVDDALRLGCAAIGFTIYPGSDDIFELMEEIRELSAEAKAVGIATVIWSYPRGGKLSKEGELALDVGAYAAHMAALAGAHIIKVKLPTDHIEQKDAKKAYEGGDWSSQAARVAHVVKACFNGRRIVVFSGGAAKGADAVFQDARDIRDGGGNGSIIGRNTFQRPRAEALAMLDKIVAHLPGGGVIEGAGEGAIPLDPGFGERFVRERRPACQLYVCSPTGIGPDFADRLRRRARRRPGGGVPAAAEGGRRRPYPADGGGADARLPRSATSPSSSTTAWTWPRNSAPTASISGRATAASATPARCSAPTSRSASPATTAATWRWKRARRGRIMSRSAPSTRRRPSPAHYRPTPDLLTWWTTLSQLPCVAIGGITPANAPPLVAAGADFICCVNAVWQHPEGPAAGVAAFGPVLAGG